MFISLNVPRQCPLVLLAKVGRKKGKVSGSEEDSTIGTLGSMQQRKYVENLG